MRFKAFSFLLSAFLLQSAVAQKAEPIYGFARVHMSKDWYKEQEKAWASVIAKEPHNALAWWYYFRVNRNLMYSYHDQDDQKIYENKLTEIQASVEQHIPGTFEYNLIKWVYNGNDFDSVKYLKKAAELGPDRIEIMDYMMNWAEIDRDIQKRDKWAKNWMATGEFSPGLMYYNYNVLAGLKPNAILLTAGDNDTYPIWLLQSKGIRKDVTVINTSLITIDSYRRRIFSELGIEGYEAFWTNDSAGARAYRSWKNNAVKILASNKKNYPVYMGVTVGENCRKGIEQDLYLTGLAMEYSTKPLDNLAQLKRNFEKEYTLDYLDKAFFTDISLERVESLKANYVVPLVKLYDHYKEAGDQGRMLWTKEKLLAIVKGTEQENYIKKHLAE